GFLPCLFSDFGARRHRVPAPDDVDERDRHLSTPIPPVAELAGEEPGEKAERHHALHDDVGKTERPRHLPVRVIVVARARERLAHLEGDRPGLAADLAAVAGADLETPVAAFLALFVDDDALGLGSEKALMRPPAQHDRPALIENQRLADHVLAVALQVTLDDETAGVNPLTDRDRREHLPFP